MKVRHQIKQKLKVPTWRIIFTILSLATLFIEHIAINITSKKPSIIGAYYLGVLMLFFIGFLMFLIWSDYIPKYKEIIIHKL